MAHFGQAGISPDGTVAYATVTFEGATLRRPRQRRTSSTRSNRSRRRTARTGCRSAPTASSRSSRGEPPSSESIGVAVALVILLFAFGSHRWAPSCRSSPRSSRSSSAPASCCRWSRANFDVATFAPILASMIGLGVGIDYSLFVINRYREAIIHGREPRAAALESVRTSGRAVQFAAATVIIALLGLFVMRINFFNGIAVAAAVTVFMVMVGALLLLPAVLSLLGTWAFVGRMAWITRRRGDRRASGLSGVRTCIGTGSSATSAGSLVLARHADRAGSGASVVRRGKAPELHHPSAVRALRQLAAEAPVAHGQHRADRDARDRDPDAVAAAGVLRRRRHRPRAAPPRIAYDLTAEGFGPGVNGPFYIAVQLPEAGDQAAVDQLTDALSADPGVALAAAAAGRPRRRRRADPALPDDGAAGRGDDRPAVPPPRGRHPAGRAPTPARRRTSVASRR